MPRIAGKLSSFTRKEVTELFAHADALSRNPIFTLLVAPQVKEFGRILIVTPRRVGSAPERNLLKRRVRALFYEEKLFKRGHDCIIIFKKGAADISFEELQQMLLEAFAKLT